MAFDPAENKIINWPIGVVSYCCLGYIPLGHGSGFYDSVPLVPFLTIIH